MTLETLLNKIAYCSFYKLKLICKRNVKAQVNYTLYEYALVSTIAKTETLLAVFTIWEDTTTGNADIFKIVNINISEKSLYHVLQNVEGATNGN